jgi:rhamnopyranosyl-N-acetylglucosaminyl-diphospho-decaprenol beta-1,3/1,4-galactofuranosyltransferase
LPARLAESTAMFPDPHPSLGTAQARIVAVVVTHDRPALLRSCLSALMAQAPRAPDLVLVVDNASGSETARVLAEFPSVRVLRQRRNLGGAMGYRVGMEAALRVGADWLWVMDDDGRPARPDCLAELHAAALRRDAALSAPLVLDVAETARLAFPVRLRGRTLFEAEPVRRYGEVEGFAHLFNGALIAASLLFRIGLPEPRFVIRGDEVEFLYRARRAGARIVLATGTPFLHPGSAAEIHPILGGAYYATLPLDAAKRFHQARNRAFIFRRYGMWGWLAADAVRYGCLHLAARRDPRGFADWAAATLRGLRGDFMREAAEEPRPEPPGMERAAPAGPRR